MNPARQNLEVGRRNPETGVRIQVGRPNLVLLTVTTENRIPWLANPVAHYFLREDWRFQSRGWHHRLRQGEDDSTKWLYVQENPIRKGLARRVEERLFKGMVRQIIW